MNPQTRGNIRTRTHTPFHKPTADRHLHNKENEFASFANLRNDSFSKPSFRAHKDTIASNCKKEKEKETIISPSFESESDSDEFPATSRSILLSSTSTSTSTSSQSKDSEIPSTLIRTRSSVDIRSPLHPLLQEVSPVYPSLRPSSTPQTISHPKSAIYCPVSTILAQMHRHHQTSKEKEVDKHMNDIPSSQQEWQQLLQADYQEFHPKANPLPSASQPHVTRPTSSSSSSSSSAAAAAQSCQSSSGTKTIFPPIKQSTSQHMHPPLPLQPQPPPSLRPIGSKKTNAVSSYGSRSTSAPVAPIGKKEDWIIVSDSDNTDSDLTSDSEVEIDLTSRFNEFDCNRTKNGDYDYHHSYWLSFLNGGDLDSFITRSSEKIVSIPIDRKYINKLAVELPDGSNLMLAGKYVLTPPSYTPKLFSMASTQPYDNQDNYSYPPIEYTVPPSELFQMRFVDYLSQQNNSQGTSSSATQTSLSLTDAKLHRPRNTHISNISLLVMNETINEHMAANSVTCDIHLTYPYHVRDSNLNHQIPRRSSSSDTVHPHHLTTRTRSPSSRSCLIHLPSDQYSVYKRSHLCTPIHVYQFKSKSSSTSMSPGTGHGFLYSLVNLSEVRTCLSNAFGFSTVHLLDLSELDKDVFFSREYIQFTNPKNISMEYTFLTFEGVKLYIYHPYWKHLIDRLAGTNSQRKFELYQDWCRILSWFEFTVLPVLEHVSKPLLFVSPPSNLSSSVYPHVSIH